MHTAEVNIDSRPAPAYARRLFFGALLALSLLACGREIVTVLQLAWHVDEYTHILLILPVSFALIYSEKDKLGKAITYAPGTGSLLAVFAIVIGATAKSRILHVTDDITLSIVIFALVLFWMACIIGCYGTRFFRSLLFPFLFLFLLVPPPLFLLDEAIVYLQGASTTATVDLFKLTRLPVLRNGFILTFPTLQIEVAKECSGIRSSIMLLITGLILAHLFLRSLWSKIVFVLLIIPLSVIKNAIRIFTLSVLAMYVNPGFLYGRLHHEGGIVFFLIALGGLISLLWVLQRFGPATPTRSTSL